MDVKKYRFSEKDEAFLMKLQKIIENIYYLEADVERNVTFNNKNNGESGTMENILSEIVSMNFEGEVMFGKRLLKPLEDHVFVFSRQLLNAQPLDGSIRNKEDERKKIELLRSETFNIGESIRNDIIDHLKSVNTMNK